MKKILFQKNQNLPIRINKVLPRNSERIKLHVSFPTSE